MLEQYNKLLEQLDEGLINQAECIQHMVVIASTHECKEENSNAYN